MLFDQLSVYRAAQTVVCGLLIVACPWSIAWSQEDEANYNEKAMALYADAANFQTNGALDLAIEGWKRYLEKYPQEPFATKAAHYLGVCYMQQAEPDYPAACDAFRLSVKDTSSDLREESLVNLGWCEFAAAGSGEQQDKERLKKSLDAFTTLLKERPNSKFADRALFYGGEAAYGLSDAKRAIEFYDRLISLDSAKDSPLRCDAYYARGVALEDVQRYDDAVKSYQQLIGACASSQTLVDAQIRMGDVLILQKKYDKAVEPFAAVAAGKSEMVPYALLRQAFALIQLNKAQEAASLYERLATQFPDSPYAATATLASAQSIYRAGDLDEAKKRFTKVLSQKNPAAATEAAHWLATIAIRKGNAQEAIDVASKQLNSGATGDYLSSLKLDLAEAMMLAPGKTAEAQKLFLDAYRAAPQDPQASRALYNAAFASMQTGKTEEATALAEEFLKTFKGSALSPDVRYIIAESRLMGGVYDQAAKDYAALLAEPATEQNPQKPLWILRAGMADYLAGRPDDAIKLLSTKLPPNSPPARIAEAKYIIGASHLDASRPAEAVAALQESLKADSKWLKADEAMLILGQAQSAQGKTAEAKETWSKLISAFPKSPRLDTARYNIAQTLARETKHEEAAAQYATVVNAGQNANLKPYALYGQGWNLLQAGKPADALGPLQRLVAEHKDHGLVDDAKLTIGIALRTLGKLPESKRQLNEALTLIPEGVNRGHALYELALIDQQEKRPQDAAKRLQDLVNTVPGYPNLDKVYYELGWALKESNQPVEANQAFEVLASKYPDSPLTAEANYVIGQRLYDESKWNEASERFRAALSKAKEAELMEKARYRLGWALFKANDFKASEQVFTEQAKLHPDGRLIADALFMTAENQFKQRNYQAALASYTRAKDRIVARNETAATVTDPAERQVSELVLLHGGQSAGQLEKWQEALNWYQILRQRFPETVYLGQAIYETGYAYEQLGQTDQALTHYEKVANEFRNETSARARFMIGEIYFSKRELSKAIPEFQRVMYGYGAEKAPNEIKNWQAKSGFEAGRCAELLIQSAGDAAKKKKSAEIAKEFFRYVIEKHPQHELATKSQERLDVLNRMDLGAVRVAPRDALVYENISRVAH